MGHLISSQKHVVYTILNGSTQFLMQYNSKP